MDSLKHTKRMGQSTYAFEQTSLALFLLMSFSCPCLGQAVEIRARDKSQEVVHDLLRETQTFSEVRWDVHNSRRENGIAVVWSIDPFSTQSGRQRYFADAGLSLRIMSAVPNRAWQVTQKSDSTDLSEGIKSASVSAACSELGEATLGLTVTFRSEPSSIPAAGEYRTLLIGTITAP